MAKKIICESPISPKLEPFEKIVDKKYALLKSDMTLKCEYCGKEYTTKKFQAFPNLPRLPCLVLLRFPSITVKLMSAKTAVIFF